MIAFPSPFHEISLHRGSFDRDRLVCLSLHVKGASGRGWFPASVESELVETLVGHAGVVRELVDDRASDLVGELVGVGEVGLERAAGRA